MQTENLWRTGTWSDKLAPYLHRMPAVAERHGWPFIVEGVFDPDATKGGQTVVVFVGAGGLFGEETLVQPMDTGNVEPVRIPLWSPTAPTSATYGGTEIELSPRNADGITYLTLPGGAAPDTLRIHFEGHSATSVEHLEAAPLRPELAQNYPNPFNGGTVIPYTLQAHTTIALEVFNLAGQKLIVLLQGPPQPGQYEAVWDGRTADGKLLASDVYIYRLRTDSREHVRKLLLLR